jgi:glycosyltransferase involved in cell wall biosynthesis
VEDTHLVSVLMPAYNAQKYINKAIKSVLSNTYSNIELLIADDCSSDNTWNIIKSINDSRIRSYKNQNNQGYLSTWNFLISQAKGEYISFCDADDFISESKIEKQVSFLNDHREIDICGCKIAVISEDEVLIKEKTYPHSDEEIKLNLLNENNFPFAGSAVIIRRAVYDKIGGYRNFYDRLGWEDHDWLIRCCEKFKSSNLLDVHYYYRQSNISVTRTISLDDFHKFFIKKIGIEISALRLKTGVDLIDSSNFWTLHKLVLKYEEEFIKDRSRLYYNLAANSKTKAERINYLKKAINISPFNLKYYYKLITSI